MRFALLASALALAACSDSNAPPDVGPDCAPDVVSCRCNDGTESSHDVCRTEWCNCDGHRGPPDASADVRAVDVSDDRPAPIDAPAADVGTDVGQVDAGTDSGSDAGPRDAGATDTGADSGSDAGPGDVGTDAGPGDTGLSCALPDGGALSVDPQSNPDHCGGCNRRCCGRFCALGRCTADGPPGTLACPLTPEEELARGCVGAVQVDPATDPNHCGSCSTRCGPGQTCMARTCSGG